jgi:hypothetical protein
LDDPSRPPLDYAPLRPPGRAVHPVRLSLALAFIAIGVAGLVVTVANFEMPMPDPPPKDDPYWQRNAARQRRFDLGCCGGLPLGCAGLVLLVTSFPRRHRQRG